MGFPIGDLFRIRSFLLAVVQSYQLFEDNLMATCKSPTKKQSNFIARFRSAEHFDFKRFHLKGRKFYF